MISALILSLWECIAREIFEGKALSLDHSSYDAEQPRSLSTTPGNMWILNCCYTKQGAEGGRNLKRKLRYQLSTLVCIEMIIAIYAVFSCLLHVCIL
jgi:hypothetical protein